MVNTHQRAALVARVRNDVRDIQVKRFRCSKARTVQKQRDKDVAKVQATSNLEALSQQFHESLIRELRGLRLLDLRSTLVTNKVSAGRVGSVRCPCVAQKGPVASIFVRRLVCHPVERVAGVAWIDLCRRRSDLAQPTEKPGQVVDDVRAILRPESAPAETARVDARAPVEGSGVQPLSEVLEQPIGVAFRRVALEVVEKQLGRTNDLLHPCQASVMPSRNEVVEQRREQPPFGQQCRQLCERARGIRVDLGSEADDDMAHQMLGITGHRNRSRGPIHAM